MVFRPPIRIIFLSFFLGIMVLAFFVLFNRPEFAVAYGILSVDEALPDRSIGELLKTAGFDEYYSESTIRIYIDDFGRPRGFYLDQYREVLDAFDPRNDGYAEKLRSFFVNNGRRIFFIPLGYNVQYYQIERRLAAAMGTIPFSLDILGSSRPMLLWFIFQLLALIIALAISRDRIRFTLQIPIILAFAWEGLPGLAMAGILAGLWELLREPLDELLTPKPYGSFKERLGPYRFSFFWAIFFVLLFFTLFIIWNIHPIPVFFGFFSFFLLEFLSFKKTKRKKSRNLYFSPVLIITSPKRPYAFRFPILVFALCSLSALLFFLFFPWFSPELIGNSPVNIDNFPLASEYEEYMAFQASFSLVPLFPNQGEHLYAEYLQYILGEDGLIAETALSLSAWEIPPFPLEKLTCFLLDYNNKTLDAPQPIILKDWIIVSLILIFCIPFTQKAKKRHSKNKTPLIRDPRIAA